MDSHTQSLFVAVILGLLVGFVFGVGLGYDLGYAQPEEPRQVPARVNIRATTIILNESDYLFYWNLYLDQNGTYNANYSYFIANICLDSRTPNTTIYAHFSYAPSTWKGHVINFEAYAVYWEGRYDWRVVDMNFQPPIAHAWGSNLGFIFLGYAEVALPISFFPAGLSYVAYQEVDF